LMQPAKRATLHEDIMEQVVTEIESGVWKPGDRFPGEFELAEKFQVSRNCIREVMKALSLIGVVEAAPGQGTFVSAKALSVLANNEMVRLMTQDPSMKDLVEVRLLIETQLAAWAAERATDDDIARLEAAIERDFAAPLADLNAAADFHNVIAEISGNIILLKLLNSIRNELMIERNYYKKWPKEMLQKFRLEHKQIYESIKARDSKKAYENMSKHISETYDLTSIKS
jgi:GntR family transcriptional repressor for pyruvate dehydrogenase complex